MPFLSDPLTKRGAVNISTWLIFIYCFHLFGMQFRSEVKNWGWVVQNYPSKICLTRCPNSGKIRALQASLHAARLPGIQKTAV